MWSKSLGPFASHLNLKLVFLLQGEDDDGEESSSLDPKRGRLVDDDNNERSSMRGVAETERDDWREIAMDLGSESRARDRVFRI